jgi:murein DD-endopeptidase MepM/ murein hydrolase activator NlpD
VVASGQGVVEFAGVRGGYGKLVIVNHSGGYATYYAHLSAFGAGIKRGTKVAQGRPVGYVGQTGWATGPHLHFELRHRNRPLDPLRATLFGAPPLEGKQLQAFNRQANTLLQRIALMRSIQVGSIDS